MQLKLYLNPAKGYVSQVLFHRDSNLQFHSSHSV